MTPFRHPFSSCPVHIVCFSTAVHASIARLHSHSSLLVSFDFDPNTSALALRIDFASQGGTWHIFFIMHVYVADRNTVSLLLSFQPSLV